MAKIPKEVQMNYILGTLAVAVVILFLYAKSLYSENKQLEENNKLIITAYETSIETLENKAKFEKEILTQKEPVIKASEKVKIENQKRGTIENNTSNDFVVTSF